MKKPVQDFQVEAEATKKTKAEGKLDIKHLGTSEATVTNRINQ